MSRKSIMYFILNYYVNLLDQSYCHAMKFEIVKSRIEKLT
jgi:hypothetical protein